MTYKRPLTEEEFEQAKLNGIPRARVHARYYQSDWSAQRAITEPVKQRGNSEHRSFLAIAKENGISRAKYYERISEGMVKQDACTIPTQGAGRPRKRGFTDKQLEIAISNGISRQALQGRLRRNWDIERAITEPPLEFWQRNKGTKSHILVGRKSKPRKVETQEELTTMYRNLDDYTKKSTEIASKRYKGYEGNKRRAIPEAKCR